MKYRDNKKAQRESETHKEKAEKAKRAARKVDHRKTPRNSRGEMMVPIGSQLATEGPATKDGALPMPVDGDHEEELTVVG